MEARSNRRTAAFASGVIAAAIVFGLMPGAAPAQAQGELGCDVVLADEVQGAQAVEQLGTDLAEVAGDHDLTSAELGQELRTDDALWVDRCGALFYTEPVRASTISPVGADQPTTPDATVVPTSETFTLHSRPGAQRVIYLDFDGYALSGTAWNSSYGLADGYLLSAYDANGQPAFSDAELQQFQSIWQRVAEDFAPFDVDVTTEDPGTDAINRASAADEVYGTRAVITNETAVQAQCGCGGHAYLGVFSRADAHAYFQPAIVYARSMSWNAKHTAEAISHEVGHNLGLSHDGNATQGYYGGHDAWAPIMGIGYSRPVSQWSKGEYAGANNSQDDLLVIANNGAPRRADDHADAQADATSMGQAVATTGVITDAADRDWFAFDGGGPTQVMVVPNAVAPNLDVAANLYDETGTVVGQSDPATTYVHYDEASGLDARITLDLPAGRYFLEVQGVGAGDPATLGYSSYGSLGQYQVAVDTPSELSVATAAVPVGARRKPYSTALSALGGTAPYTWRVSRGVLPVGLTLTSGGVIAGIPTTLGTSSFEVEAADAVGRRATATMSIYVAGPITVATTTVPMASDDAPYSATLVHKGGGGTKRWTLTTGVMPPGLSLSTGGVISGTPTTPGIYRLPVQVVDGAGQIGRRALTLNVAPLPPARVSRVATKRYDGSFDVNFLPVSSALRPHAVTEVLLDGVPFTETTGTSVRFDGVTPGRKYRVDLIAEGPGGRSAAYTSYPVAITVPAAPSAPVATVGALVGTGRALLSWTAAPTTIAAPRAGYRIYRDGVPIGTTTSTKYTARTLQPGRTYNFVIRTYGPAGEGGQVAVSAVPS